MTWYNAYKQEIPLRFERFSTSIIVEHLPWPWAS